MYDYKQQCEEVLKYGIQRLSAKDYSAILNIIIFGKKAADYLTPDEMVIAADDFKIVENLVERADYDKV